jgi:uncharacterized protein YggE
MKSFIRLTIIGLFLSTSTYAQNAPSTLVVGGNSKVLVVPDVARISVELASINKDYSVCMDSLKSQSESLRKFMIGQGIEMASIKSNRFQIGTNYDYESGRGRKNGYQAKQSIVVEVINDLDKVNKIADAIGKSKTKGEISIKFELSENNKQKVKSLLIANAIKDATSKADAIVKNSNITLGKLMKIDYGVSPNYRSNKNYIEEKAFYCLSQDDIYKPQKTLSISPEEIEMTDDIIMEWEILK